MMTQWNFYFNKNLLNLMGVFLEITTDQRTYLQIKRKYILLDIAISSLK